MIIMGYTISDDCARFVEEIEKKLSKRVLFANEPLEGAKTELLDINKNLYYINFDMNRIDLSEEFEMLIRKEMQHALEVDTGESFRSKEELRQTIKGSLVKFFNEIMDLEEKAIITKDFKDISNNDMHIIEAVGLGEGKRMSVIAKQLNITVGSLTTSMNALVKKGYVARQRSERDRRVVNIYLLEKGIAAYKHHEEYHNRMTDKLIEKVTEEELKVWVKSFEALHEFFYEESKR